MQQWNEVERRSVRAERRHCSERRLPEERRFDYRDAPSQVRRSIKSWLRSLSNARLGVDRRKGYERRLQDRRSQELRSLLTPEELAALLQE